MEDVVTEFEHRVKAAITRIGIISRSVASDGELTRAAYFDMILRDVQHQERVAAIQAQTEQLTEATSAIYHMAGNSRA